MTRGKGAPPYVHQAWPKLLYHQKTGEHREFRKQSLVPDDGMWGLKATVGKSEEEVSAEKQTVLDEAAATQKLADDEAADIAAELKADDKAAKAIFKKLKMSREEAEEILTEEKVEFDPDADDLEIAMQLKELLEDGDSE